MGGPEMAPPTPPRPVGLAAGQRFSPWRRLARHDTDGTVLLENGEAHVRWLDDTRPAKRRVQILEGHALAREVIVQDATVVDEERRRRLEQPARALRAVGDLDDPPVQYQNDHGPDEPAEERVVRPDHRVLDDVRDQQQDDEVERRELADLTLAGEAERQEDEEVHDDRAHDLLVERNLRRPDPGHGLTLGRGAGGRQDAGFSTKRPRKARSARSRLSVRRPEASLSTSVPCQAPPPSNRSSPPASVISPLAWMSRDSRANVPSPRMARMAGRASFGPTSQPCHTPASWRTSVTRAPPVAQPPETTPTRRASPARA